jgi:hypothetical protein
MTDSLEDTSDLEERLEALARTRASRKVDVYDWEYINILFEGTIIINLPDLVIERIIDMLPCISRIYLFKQTGISPCYTVQSAIDQGHIECLRNYGHIDWNRRYLSTAALYGRFNVLAYAYENGATVYQHDIDILYESHSRCIEYEIDECDHVRCIEMYEKLRSQVTTSDPISVSVDASLLFDMESD